MNETRPAEITGRSGAPGPVGDLVSPGNSEENGFHIFDYGNFCHVTSVAYSVDHGRKKRKGGLE